jgi:hypothetical protein
MGSGAQQGRRRARRLTAAARREIASKIAGGTDLQGLAEEYDLQPRSIRRIARAAQSVDGSAKQRAPLHTTPEFRHRARMQRLECVNSALRPPHIKAPPFSDAWWVENNRSFVDGMRRAHPELGESGARKVSSPSESPEASTGARGDAT